MITALRTGFRILELLLLTWEDVDFRSRVITVRAVYVKNGKGRSVPMNEVLTTTLQAVRMSIAADGPVFRTVRIHYTDPLAQRLHMQYARRV